MLLCSAGISVGINYVQQPHVGKPQQLEPESRIVMDFHVNNSQETSYKADVPSVWLNTLLIRK